MIRVRGRARRLGRTLLLVALPLVLGFLTTWLIAWLCAVFVVPLRMAWIDPPPVPPAASPLPATYLNVSPRFGWGCDSAYVSVQLLAQRPLPALWQLQQPRIWTWSAAREAWDAGQPAPPGVRPIDTHDMPASGSMPAHVRQLFQWREASSGWPWRCLHWLTIDGGRSSRRFVGAFAPDWLIGASCKGLDAALPYHPIWAGMILNTLLFGTIWFTALRTPGVVRVAITGFRLWRYKRRSQFSCPKCGYDLRGCDEPGCPECGDRRE